MLELIHCLPLVALETGPGRVVRSRRLVPCIRKVFAGRLILVWMSKSEGDGEECSTNLYECPVLLLATSCGSVLKASCGVSSRPPNGGDVHIGGIENR